MFVLFVDMKLKPGAQAALEKTYTETFRPAISQQEGFRGVELLRPEQDRRPMAAQHFFRDP